MPEEKVRPIDPQREMECDCDPMYSHRCPKCWGRGWVPTPPADAGPRQHVQVERSLMEGIRSFMNRRFDQDRLIKYQDHFIREIDRILAAPPVPQEAAPRLCTNCKEESWTHCRFHEPAHCHVECAQGTVPPWPTEQYPPRCKRVEPATAPDSAMRVAEQLYRDVYQDCDCNHDTSDFDIFKSAALIREAGSERERDTMQALRECKQMLESLRYMSSCDLPSQLEQKISRLLGGESNATTK